MTRGLCKFAVREESRAENVSVCVCVVAVARFLSIQENNTKKPRVHTRSSPRRRDATLAPGTHCGARLVRMHG